MGDTDDSLQLVAHTVKWLAKDKVNASVSFAPNAAAAQGGGGPFSGFEGSGFFASAVDGPWAEVPGDPASPLRLLAASQAPAQFYRARN